jgi:hypothetical protein
MNDQLKNIIARFGQAFTDENAAFNFPIKYPAIDLDKPTKEALYKTAGIIAGGLIVMGVIIAAGKRGRK